jgi:hypothetical protein
MTDNSKSNEPASESTEERQHRLELKRYKIEKWTLFFLFVYVSIAAYQGCQMKKSVDIAHNTFVAANKPSVGINGIIVAYLETGANGKTVLIDAPNERTTNFDFRVEIKNFGTVPADNFVPSWKVLINGIQQRGGTETSKPATIFPGKSIYLTGQAGTENYQAIMTGQSVLELETTVRYEGPGQNYTYCEKDRFGPKVNAFLGLGAVCTQ